MTTQPEAKQVPLVERLESVPVDARLAVDDGLYSTSFYAVGAMAHEAADELRRQHADIQQLNAQIFLQMKWKTEAQDENERLREVNAELLGALQLALSAHGRMLMSDPPQDAWKAYGVEEKASAAIARAEEVKP